VAKSYKRIEKIIRKIFPDYSGLKDDFTCGGFSDELRSIADKGTNASKYHMTSIEAYAIISILGSIIIDYNCGISLEGINFQKLIEGANEILQEEKISLEIDISDELVELLTYLLASNYDSLEIEIDHTCDCPYCNCSMEAIEVGLYNLIEDYEGEKLLDKIEYININK